MGKMALSYSIIIKSKTESTVMQEKKKINWGILATGRIAGDMAQALKCVKSAKVLGVASRSLEKAKEFAKKHSIEKTYGSYEEMAQDPDIDVIYIATPHPCHFENIVMCLKMGKNVLCEKPMVINQKQAQEVINLAREKNLFLMEAHKSYFLPGIKKLKELVDGGMIGEIKEVKADFCINPEFDKDNRYFNLELCGGALLDVGSYNILFATHLLGQPTEITSNTVIGKTGVDEFSTVVMKHKSGANSVLCYGINSPAPIEALVMGENGYIKVGHPFHQAPKLTVKVTHKEPVEIDITHENGLAVEAQCVVNALLAGKKECAEFGLEKSLELVKIMDTIRSQCNLKYPCELI